MGRKVPWGGGRSREIGRASFRQQDAKPVCLILEESTLLSFMMIYTEEGE